VHQAQQRDLGRERPGRAGDPDYLLRVVARDLLAYRQLYDERLATLPGVLRLSSTLVMKSVVDARPLPL
jgi:DNA-binding Lrp family transcriptional regulator